MKKALSLILALVLCLSLCACGNSKYNALIRHIEANDYNNALAELNNLFEDGDESVIYKLGDTVNTDIAELVLLDITYNYDYSPYFDVQPKDGYSFIAVKFSLKNIGKKTWDSVHSSDGSETTNIGDIVWLDYNDGYIFEMNDIHEKDGSYVAAGFFLSVLSGLPNDTVDDLSFGKSYLKPLSEAIVYRVVICVPNEVIENKEAPLLVNINIPNSQGKSKTAIFSVR